MRLAFIFDKSISGTTGMYFERACRMLGISADHFWLREADSIPSGYDLYLRIDHGDDYEVPLPERLRPKIFYAIDSHLRHNRPKIARVARTADGVFCAHREAASWLPNCEWVPVGCDPELHGRIELEEQWDVAFVGTEGGSPRKFYLQALREKYPNSRIGLAPYTEIARIYSAARVGFNYAIAGDVNMRLFETLAGGALLVTNAIPHGQMEALGLNDGEHLVVYRKPREVFDRIEHYLARPDERRRIASAGRSAALERHTYAHRLKQILRACSERLGLIKEKEIGHAGNPV